MSNYEKLRTMTDEQLRALPTKVLNRLGATAAEFCDHMFVSRLELAILVHEVQEHCSDVQAAE
jgi:hypothetical protein